MSRLFCVYCGNEVREEWPVCCGENHTETEEEQAMRLEPTGESFEAFVERMTAQQEQEQ